MPVVNQGTASPGRLNFNRFSPHAFHLDKKIEVFAAEGSPNHESPGQLKFPGSVFEIISLPYNRHGIFIVSKGELKAEDLYSGERESG